MNNMKIPIIILIAIISAACCSVEIQPNGEAEDAGNYALIEEVRRNPDFLKALQNDSTRVSDDFRNKEITQVAGLAALIRNEFDCGVKKVNDQKKAVETESGKYAYGHIILLRNEAGKKLTYIFIKSDKIWVLDDIWFTD